MRPLLIFAASLALSLFAITATLSAQCEMDTIPPTVSIVDLSSAVLVEDELQVELFAVDFTFFAFDDCTPDDSLRFTFTSTAPENDSNFISMYRSSSKIFDCYDVINSPVIVNIYAWDMAGNSMTDSVYLTLVNNSTTDCEDEVSNKRGIVSNLAGDYLDGVTVFLNRSDGEILESVTTNDQGLFSFFTNTNNKYLTVAFEDESSHNINGEDLFMIQQHLLGITPLEGPSLLAADFSADGNLRNNDLFALKELILGNMNEEDIPNSEWQFVSKDFNINSNEDKHEYRILLKDNVSTDIIGFRFGDVVIK